MIPAKERPLCDKADLDSLPLGAYVVSDETAAPTERVIYDVNSDSMVKPG